MSSAFRDRKGWIISFRPPLASGRARRRVRLSGSDLAGEPDPGGAARRLAAECERLCRVLDAPTAPDPARVREALRLRAITPAEAQTFLGYAPPPPPRHSPGLEALSASHPATQRERDGDPDSYERHMRELREFIAWSGVDSIEAVTLLLVLRYVSHLKAEGYSFYSRRHRLVMVRRATRMAASYGFADPLAGMVVDRSEARAEPEAWTLEELIAGLRALVEEKHERALAATALGGLLGLRSSEIFRVRVGDVGAEVVRVGARERKNAASRRDLPIPRVVRPWLEALREGRRSPEAPLLLTRYRRPGPFTADTFGHWLGPILARVTGRALPPKCLRKTFATWALEAGLDEYRVEAWLGHRAGNVAGVTSRHYLAIIRGRKLQELAAQIDAIVAPLLAGAPPAATRVPATPSASVRSDAG